MKPEPIAKKSADSNSVLQCFSSQPLYWL